MSACVRSCAYVCLSRWARLPAVCLSCRGRPADRLRAAAVYVAALNPAAGDGLHRRFFVSHTQESAKFYFGSGVTVIWGRDEGNFNFRRLHAITEGGVPTCMAFSPGGDFLATGCEVNDVVARSRPSIPSDSIAAAACWRLLRGQEPFPLPITY